MAVDVANYAVFTAAMVGSPGPANMVLLSAGARFGLRPAVPFLTGVILGKQLIIWPLGLGLMTVASNNPSIMTTLKWASAAYIVWLSWNIARSAIRPALGVDQPPSLASGLIVHPLNPKAWVMVTTGLSAYTEPGTPALIATFAIAGTLIATQIVLQPLWCWGGSWLAERLADTPAERWLMITLAILTLASVALVLAKGL